MSVRYFERVETDDERRTFFVPRRSVIHTINSSRIRAVDLAATETEIDRTFDPVDDTTYTTNRCYTLSSSAKTTILGACHDH